jgi:DnaJ-class molecular chaperone
MYDLSAPNQSPGTCCKCSGSGVFSWGAVVNGQPSKSGPCHSCKGTGQQTARQIATNHAYNRYKIAMLCEAA